MATTPNTAYKPHPTTVVRTTERLWSTVVGEAQGLDEDRHPPAYVFGNGRVFIDPKPYSWVPQPDPDAPAA